MIIFPAIDIKNGNCVRLFKGNENSETVYSSDPVSVARKWEDYGASWIHVVDLDGAFDGRPKNFELIKNIVNSVECKVQLGGGIRNIDTAKSYIDAGVERVIIGTAAFADDNFLKEVCEIFPNKVAVGIDTKQGKIAVKGWKEVIDDDITTVIDRFYEIGVSLIISTNVDKDGTLEGIEAQSIKTFLNQSKLPVIVSGGFASISDLESVYNLDSENLEGVILGKSIYTDSINLKQAIARFQ
ncbi:MAG: 1-(5-phosphoribosyl)-5-[(5-phosphoribosylamino)methylideneamino]imidazole-4-carboxamide isomerase [Thermodesulfobacteriota bacterium]